MRILVAVSLLGAACFQPVGQEGIGQSGGRVEVSGASVEAPPGALTAGVEVRIAVVDQFPPAPSDRRLRTPVFELTPHDQLFAADVTLRIPGKATDTLLTAQPGGTWSAVEGATFKDGAWEARVRHFSYFATASASTGGLIHFSELNGLHTYTTARLDLGVFMPAGDRSAPGGMAVDPTTHKVYWTDHAPPQKVLRADADGQNRELLYEEPNMTPGSMTGIAVDPAQDRLFWTNPPSVWTSRRDGSQRTEVIAGIAQKNYPYAVTIDPAHQQLYWFETTGSTLWRSNYDGSSVTAVFTYPTDQGYFGYFKGLAVDYDANLIFFGDMAGVRRCHLDGSGFSAVVSGAMLYANAIDLDRARQVIYWTDATGLHSVNYDGSNKVDLFPNLRPSTGGYSVGVTFDPDL